jgi:hypothetical protein
MPALLGVQRGDVAATRALWALQNNLALTPDEENAIELKRALVAGQERVIWDTTLALPPKEFELTDAELARLKAALETWGNYVASPDRRWPHPLVEALFSNELQT